jgi:hypothetical protein
MGRLSKSDSKRSKLQRLRSYSLVTWKGHSGDTNWCCEFSKSVS